MSSRNRRRTALALATLAAALGSLGAAAGLARAATSEITLYSRPEGRGDRRSFDRGERDLERYGWGDRAASVRVDSGRWELCRDRDFRGCRVFSRGEYDLRDTPLDRRLMSLRPLDRDDDNREPVYSRPQARYIAQRLYRALLDRNVDEDSVRDAVDEVQNGKLRAQVDSMVRSPEFRRSSGGLGADALLDQIYQGLLGRGVDPGGSRTYLPRIQRRDYTGVVIDIVESREFARAMPR
jgi:hypothetical protein